MKKYITYTEYTAKNRKKITPVFEPTHEPLVCESDCYNQVQCDFFKQKNESPTRRNYEKYSDTYTYKDYENNSESYLHKNYEQKNENNSQDELIIEAVEYPEVYQYPLTKETTNLPSDSIATKKSEIITNVQSSEDDSNQSVQSNKTTSQSPQSSTSSHPQHSPIIELTRRSVPNYTYYNQQPAFDNYDIALSSDSDSNYDCFPNNNLHTNIDNESKTAPEKSQATAKRRLTRSGFFVSIILFLCFSLAVTCAVFMSQGLTFAHITGSIRRASSPKQTAYCIYMTSSDSLKKASEDAVEIRKIGGGGFCLEDEDKYFVLLSGYPKENDCDSVIDSLKKTKMSPQKYVLEIPKLSLDSTLKKDELDSVISAYETLFATYTELYKISIELDTKAITPTNSFKRFDSLRKDIEKKSRTIKDFKEFETIRKACETTVSQLDNLTNEESENSLSSNIKYAYLKILSDTKTLVKNFA